MKAVDDAALFGIMYTNIDHHIGHTEYFIDRQSNNSDLPVLYGTMPTEISLCHMPQCYQWPQGQITFKYTFSSLWLP